MLAAASSRHITTSTLLSSHENPLGLPRKGTPPNLAARMQRGLPEKRKIKDVKKVIAVSSAKGGVGKSTIAGESPVLCRACSKKLNVVEWQELSTS